MRLHRHKAVYQGGEGEIVEKKSRFIATVESVGTEEEAINFIESVKKKHWNAAHNCSAFILGSDPSVLGSDPMLHMLQRCSDDGEPSGTAGKPMLEVLLSEEICNVAVVVTRYFGGTLLGTGGLVRAYTNAVKEGLRQSTVIERRLGRKVELETEYSDLGKIQYLLGENGIAILNSEYSDQVYIELAVSIEELAGLREILVEATMGRINIKEGEKVFFATLNDEIILFD